MTKSVSKVSLSKLTNTQLQQKIIHLESELKKHKHLLERYQNDYHYDLIDRLQAEKEAQEQQFIELEQQLTVEQTKIKNHQTELSSIQNHYEKEIKKLKKENEELTLQIANVQLPPHAPKSQPTDSQSKEVFPYLQNFNDAVSPKETKEIENNDPQNQNWFYRNFSKKQSEDK